MIKKWFDWTPHDIAEWEKIRAKKLGYFLLWYGVVISGGILFIVLGGATLLLWGISLFLKNQTADTNTARPDLAFLALEFIFITALCLLGGLINSLVTWFVEENLYRKYKNALDPSK